eukprot:g4362.t1
MASFISSDALEQIGTFDADATPIKRRGGRGFTPTKPSGTPTSRMTPKRFGMHSAHNTPKLKGSSTKLSAINVHSNRSGSIGTPTLVFDAENIHPNSSRKGRKGTPLNSIKPRSNRKHRTPSHKAGLGSSNSLSESCSSLPSISGRASAKKHSGRSGRKQQRPFSSPSSVEQGLGKLNLDTSNLACEQGDVSLLTISKFEHQSDDEESEKLEEKVVTPIQGSKALGKHAARRPLGFIPFGKTLTVSPADSSFSPASRSFLTQREDKERNAHGGGVMKKTNIQRVLAERMKVTMFQNKPSSLSSGSRPVEDEENGGGSTNSETKVRTPRQLPSLKGLDGMENKNKFGSPTDMFMSPVSRNFHTVGEDGKLRKGNVRKLIALKGKNDRRTNLAHEGGKKSILNRQPLNGRRESSLRNVSTHSSSSFNKK